MLLEEGDVFEIKDARDLDKIRDCIRANRGSANRKVLDELYALYVYLCFRIRIKEGLSICPVSIKKSESPDFVIRSQAPGGCAGIEITTSTPCSMKHAESYQKKCPDSMLEPCYYRSDVTSKEKAKSGLRRADEKLQGDGYSKNGREIDWVDAVRRRLEEKFRKLNAGTFRTFQSNELIVNDDYGLFPDFGWAISRLSKHFDPSSYEIKFDKVHIVSRNKFLYDVFGHCEFCDYKF